MIIYEGYNSVKKYDTTRLVMDNEGKRTLGRIPMRKEQPLEVECWRPRLGNIEAENKQIAKRGDKEVVSFKQPRGSRTLTLLCCNR